MAGHAITAEEYARFKREERAYELQMAENSVRLIFSRDAAVQARDIQMPTGLRVVPWFSLLLILRALFSRIRLGASGKLREYGYFRAYMQQNRQAVQAEWEGQCAQVKALDAKIADKGQCNIPPEYHPVAGILLGYIKSGRANSMCDAIERYESDKRHKETLEQIAVLQRQQDGLREEAYRTQRNVAILEGLLAFHCYYHHR